MKERNAHAGVVLTATIAAVLVREEDGASAELTGSELLDEIRELRRELEELRRDSRTTPR